MDIILIQGANQAVHDEKLGTDILKTKWLNYIKSGFIKHGFDVALLNKVNFKFLYYADLRENITALVTNEMAFQTMSEHSKLLLESQIEELEQDPEIKSSLQAQNNTQTHNNSFPILTPSPLGFTETLIDRIISLLEGKYSAVDKLFVKIVFKEALYYIDNQKYVKAIQTRLDKIIGDSKDYIILSHSLGTLVAYTHACQAPQKSIRKLVTMGSPLAIKFVESLRQKPLVVPSSIITDWINLYDKEDFVAVYPLAKPKYNITPDIDNRIVHTIDSKPHNIQGYLESEGFCQLLNNELKSI